MFVKADFWHGTNAVDSDKLERVAWLVRRSRITACPFWLRSILFGAALPGIAAPHRTLVLSMREAVQLAVEHNPEVEASRLSLRRATALLVAAQGVFDPLIRIGGEARRETRPVSSLLEGSGGRVDEHRLNGSAGFSQRLPWRGLSLAAQIENTRQSSTNPFFSLTPFYTPRLSLTLDLPLLRNGGTDADRTELRVQAREIRASAAELETRLVDVVLRVETAYWQLVAARESVEASRLSEQASADSLGSTERLVREGSQASSELAGAQGQLARAQEATAGAVGNERQAQHALQALLAASETDLVLETDLHPSDRRANDDGSTTDILLATALRSRPELRTLSERLQQAGDRVQLASNGLLPRVDLQLGYVTQGLSGRSAPSNTASSLSIPGFSASPPPGVIGNTWTGFGAVFDNRFPTYYGSLTIEIPLRNRSAEGRYRDARLAARQAMLQEQQVRIQIATDVRQALDNVAAAKARLSASEAAVTASEGRLSSELRMLREGQSSNLNLNVRQNELSESRQLLVRARQQWNTAQTELDRATGQMLTRCGVQVEGKAENK